MARVMRQGVRHQANFSLKSHKTWEAAEREGAKWVRAKIKELPPPTTCKDRMTKSNSSGVVGVHFDPHIVKKLSGKKYSCPRWVARWPQCKKRGGVFWYLNQWDDDGAFVLAVLSRQLEIEDRSKILTRFDEIADTAKYDAILSLRKD